MWRMRRIGLVDAGTRQEVLASLARAQRYLLSRQAPDGFWRDYWLKPGLSEDWVTACCGLALARSPRHSGSHDGIIAAARALSSARRPGGWGYNRDTVPDADSSAWVLSFLGMFGGWQFRQWELCLQAYLDESGRAHTFLSPEKSGSWGNAHADVTPVVGMALSTTAAAQALVGRVRNAVLADQSPEGHWDSFWWNTNSYATARSLEFLSITGGVPAKRAERSRRWLHAQATVENAFEAAQRLGISVLLDESSYEWLDILLEMEEGKGVWPPSPVLLAPDKDKPEQRGPAHADEEQVLGTAMVVMALKFWLSKGS
jgi:hypothetical protein